MRVAICPKLFQKGEQFGPIFRTCIYGREIEELRLIQQGHLKVKELVTHEFGIHDAVKADDMLLDRSVKFLGSIINWK